MVTSQGSQSSEAVRAQAEQARAQAEQVRAQAEQARAQMEQLREEILREMEKAGVDPRSTRIDVPSAPPAFVPGIPREAVDISIAFFVCTAAVIIFTPIMRAFARRMDRRGAAAPAHDGGRLERIEQAVDAIALEVERISEGQRFTTRLVSEMRGLPAPNAAPSLDATLLQGSARREGVPVRGQGGER